MAKKFFTIIIEIILLFSLSLSACGGKTEAPQIPITFWTGNEERTVEIVADDFIPQPYQGDAIYYYNRLEGDRGSANDGILEWGVGQVRMTIPAGASWGGGWMSLRHPIREGLGIDFSAILPAQISEEYQCQITGIKVAIGGATPGATFRLELKDGNELRWKKEIPLKGGEQVLSFRLPKLENITQLVWILDRAEVGDFIILKRIAFQAQTPVTDTATAAFVWSYGMLLDNWNPATGLVRDKAKDASGEMDAIQATGALAAATAQAEQLGVIERLDAVGIVSTIGETLLNRLPRNRGLWPHWVRVSPAGEISPLEGTEWSSVDTVIAALGLLEAQQALGMDMTATEQMMQGIDWNRLVTLKGISHGYTASGELIPYVWDSFGGESWLVALAYASMTGQVEPMAYPTPPTANGSGFIDELAWLFVPPPAGKDAWGTDWEAYRLTAVNQQVSFYADQAPEACLDKLGLFGLSAGEVPNPAQVTKENIYQAFGVGGRFVFVNDGTGSAGGQVVLPHYSAMVASLHPQEALRMWNWLIDDGHFTPLTNVESLAFSDHSSCSPEAIVWNQLKGSWNLALQALGWGRYLTEVKGVTPILWQAVGENALLQKGYQVLLQALPPPTETQLVPAPTALPPTPIPEPTKIILTAQPVTDFDIRQGTALQMPRTLHTATLLPDGRVLLVGGSRAPDEPLATAEIYDPEDGSTSLVASLHTARHGHSATLLPDGRVLVIGGYNPQGWVRDAEIYDPSADSWTVISSLYPHGVHHTATLLQDGRVLVVGGTIASGFGSGSERAEIFDPFTNTWTEVKPLQSQRSSHTAVLIDDGRVLVAGGGGPEGPRADGDAVIYDPRSNTWALAGPMVRPRLFAESVKLLDGRVLVVGGRGMDYDLNPGVLADTEIYDPRSNAWTSAEPLSQPRYGFTLTQLATGEVLAAGGTRDYDQWTAGSFVQALEIYDPGSDQWLQAGELSQPVAYATATRLSGDYVWLAGGQSEQEFWSSSWMISPGGAFEGRFAATWQYQHEAEFPEDATVGQTIGRSNASGLTVHGQFGTTAGSPWPAKSGYVRYTNITIPQDVTISVKLRYSKYSSSSALIFFSIDEEPTPRASFYPADQGNWNLFAWTEPISLGEINAGVHTLVISTDGQPYGVADLDMFILEGTLLQK